MRFFLGFPKRRRRWLSWFFLERSPEGGWPSDKRLATSAVIVCVRVCVRVGVKSRFLSKEKTCEKKVNQPKFHNGKRKEPKSSHSLWGDSFRRCNGKVTVLCGDGDDDDDDVAERPPNLDIQTVYQKMMLRGFLPAVVVFILAEGRGRCKCVFV